ncbi:MAG TPA: PTS sugar transporter subunit IIA [bacterium]|nr:PTS sugar transporter subunit IIA [bacterium]
MAPPPPILSLELIRLGEQASSRDEAIDRVGQMLVSGGYVQPAYVASMKARELTMSTYVGNGVAIPHGTFDDKTLILATGISVAQFPHGVTWDGSNIAYLVVGIAAVRQEHIGVLANLARVLEDEAVAKTLWTTTSAAFVYETLGQPWQDAP